MNNRRSNCERPIANWEELRVLIRKQCIPSHYHMDLYLKLQSLTQGSKSVGDYNKEIEIAMD